MRTHEIENWALSVIDRVSSGQPNEDQRVELKAVWIDADKAARRIAGHANSARGEPILWLMGVDEVKGVTGVSMTDLAGWHAQLAAQFNGLAPDMTPVNVPVGGKTVVALLFDTERVPFVVKVPGTDRLEVPWRGNTAVRSARRDELLRLLSPLQRAPSFQVISGSLFVLEAHVKIGSRLEWQLALMVYVVPGDTNRLVLPYHSCKCVLSFSDISTTFEFSKVWIDLMGNNSSTLTAANSELLVDGPGMFLYRHIESVTTHEERPESDAHVRLELHFVGFDRASIIETVIPIIPQLPGNWAFGRFREERLAKRDDYGEVVEETL